MTETPTPVGAEVEAGAAARPVVPADADPRIEVGQRVAGLEVAGLLADHGSPLYVYDAGVIRSRAARLRAAMPAGVDIAYAVKANSSPAVLETIRATGLGADVASGGELRAVLRAGFEAADVLFTGPGKTDAEVAAALRAGVGALTIESLDELESVIELAGEARAGQGLMLRLATEADVEETRIIGGAGAAKFGVTDAEAEEGLARLRSARLLAPAGPFAFRGFHAFGASNVRDARVLVEAVAGLARRAEAHARRFDLPLELLDGGGGLGIPYAAGEAPLDLAALGEGLARELGSWERRGPLAGARLLLEPGRWLVGPAGAYLCSVVRTKRRAGRHIAVADGGIHHLLRPRLVGQDHRVVPVGLAAGRVDDGIADLVGPLCTGLDVLAAGVASPAPERGDVYAVLDAGAYGYAESMPLFLTHPTPAEIVVDGGDVRVSRERIEPA